MAVGAIAAAAGGSILGNLMSGALNNIYEWQNRNWQSQADYEDYRANYAKDIENYFLDKQMEYNKYMSNTAFQRAIADMEAAGINPASLGGSSNAASTPVMSGAHSSYQTNARMGTNYQDLLGGNLISSAINSAIAKDHDAARLMASELVDNARHAHKMEELQEKFEMHKALNQEKNLEHVSKADYYDEMARSIRHNRGW